MAVVMGFGGLFNNEGQLELEPILPEGWTHLCFSLYWKGRKISIEAARGNVAITSSDYGETCLKVYGREYLLKDKLMIYKEEVRYGS